MSAASKKGAALPTHGPCIDCGHPALLVPRFVASVLVDGRALPFVLCDACRDKAADRYAAATDKTAAYEAVTRDYDKRARKAKRYLTTRILPVARALLANAEAGQ